MTSLAALTTLRLGGPADELAVCRDEESLIASVCAADDRGRSLLLLGGGSNVVVPDEGFPGLVVRIASRGIDCWEDGERTVLRVQAGESWDSLVEHCVLRGLAGVECLSGIPGSVGATPIQNVGAYGQDVQETIVQVRVYDRRRQLVRDMDAAECGFVYRSSTFKRNAERWIVLSVTYSLKRDPMSRPIRYAELARALDLPAGDVAPMFTVRAAVLRLRGAKGMVIDPNDPDTWSAGSFFLNPVLNEREFEVLEERVRRRLGEGVCPPGYPGPAGIKTSAAWLIEKTGFHRGYGDPAGIAISSKHTLALTNRGAGSTAQLMRLALEIAQGVLDAFGVALQPEPVLVGQSWPLIEGNAGAPE